MGGGGGGQKPCLKKKVHLNQKTLYIDPKFDASF